VTRLRALAFGAALTFGCSASDTKLERRGGPLPEGAGGASDDSAPPVSFCQALTVIRAKCQRCHQDPPQNGAPVPFLEYEDTQAPYVDDTLKYSDVMLLAVERDFMPYIALNDGDDPIMPPVEALTGDEKATLLGWLKQGANPEGGTDCP
jgi:hypothetical protein